MSFPLFTEDIKKEFVQNKTGLTGVIILVMLIMISIISIITIPLETFQEWNNPKKWIDLPKSSVPSWVNIFQTQKIPEHKIIHTPTITTQKADNVLITTHSFDIDFLYDDFPNDFIYEFNLIRSDRLHDSSFTSNPLMSIKVIRPDGLVLKLVSTSIPSLNGDSTSYHTRIFSTDEQIRKNLFLQSDNFEFSLTGKSVEYIVFSKTKENEILKGRYTFVVETYDVPHSNFISLYPLSDHNTSVLTTSKLIIGGKAFGIMGTDELRRDLAIGLLWGTPLALFIGISVAIGSVIVGLVYGTYAGYKGRHTDEAMMRFNDIIYALPALPFLIILTVSISSNIFLMIGFLMIFSWVGVAKVSRSMALQIKTRGYVEASKIMGQKNSRIIFRHILPQMLPYALASIAISVPAAITTEAGLSFLGLGDPTFPTWGQILHDANTYGAVTRGLWWWVMPPGIMIAVTGLAFVFIGNALDVIVNPKLKRQ